MGADGSLQEAQVIAKIGAAYLAEFEKQHAFFLSKGRGGDG
jgi:hypothetical protein